MSSYRRKFIKNLALSATLGIIIPSSIGCRSKKKIYENVTIIPRKKYRWRMVTTWPSTLPILSDSARNIARDIESLTSGELSIEVYNAGEIVPALESLQAVMQGSAQISHGASYYWAGTIPSSIFFSSIPFGLNSEEMNTWLFYQNGLKLWRKAYGLYNLIPFPAGNTGHQMGGWFNKIINTIEDIKGLKMRIPGVGGKVISKAGGTSVTLAASELYTALERGIIDATEWIGPYHDYIMGFQKIATYYYYPGWQEPGSTLEIAINKKAYESIPKNIQKVITIVVNYYNNLVQLEFQAKNQTYLKKILQESKTTLKKFPQEVLELFKTSTQQVIQEIIESDNISKEVYESVIKFKKQSNKWNNLSITD